MLIINTAQLTRSNTVTKSIRKLLTIAGVSVMLSASVMASAAASDGSKGYRSIGSMNIGLYIPADKGLQAVSVASQDSLKTSSPFCIFGVDQKNLEIKASNAEGEAISVEYLRPSVAENGDCTAKRRGLLAFASEPQGLVMLTIGVN